MLYVMETAPDNFAVDPYGVGSRDFVVGDDFAHMCCSALAHCQRRFEGQTPRYKKRTFRAHWMFHAGQFSGVRHVPRTAT